MRQHCNTSQGMFRCIIETLYPFRPPHTLTICEPVIFKLRPLGVQKVAIFTMVKLHPRLLSLIEVVEPGRECVVKIPDVSGRMQSTPRLNASLPLTRLENE